MKRIWWLPLLLTLLWGCSNQETPFQFTQLKKMGNLPLPDSAVPDPSRSTGEKATYTVDADDFPTHVVYRNQIVRLVEEDWLVFSEHAPKVIRASKGSRHYRILIGHDRDGDTVITVEPAGESLLKYYDRVQSDRSR
jgi:hypothetical protein